MIYNTMMMLPHKYILSIQPKEYLKQGPSHCGVYSVKAILSAYGKDTKGHPKEYHPNWIGRVTGTTLGKQYYVNILKKYGLQAEIHTAKKLSAEEKINLLKGLLANNTPVMVRIGNGFYESNKYSPIMGRLLAHWITLWGYDDEQKLFYVYDSGLLPSQHTPHIPIGNTKRTYNEILRDWNFGDKQFWYWPMVGSERFVYVKIGINRPM